MPLSELLGDGWVDLALEAPEADAVVRAAPPSSATRGCASRRRAPASRPGRSPGAVAAGGARRRPGRRAARSRSSSAHARAETPSGAPRRGRPAAPADAARRAIVLAHLGAVEFACGDPRAAADALEAGIALAREVHSEALLVACLGRAAALEVATGRLARAERAAHSALAVAEGRGWSAGAAWACAALAAVHWLRGELDQAEARTDLGSAAAHGSGDLLAARALRALRGHLAIARGDLAGGCASLATAGLHAEDGAGILPGWLDALGPRPVDVDAPVGAREEVEAALARLGRGDPLSALRRVEPLLVPAAAVHPTLRLHARLVAAVASQAVGRPTVASDHLERALELASVEGCRQPFARAGLALQPLLERHLTLPTAWAPLAAELLGALAGADPAATLDRAAERSRARRAAAPADAAADAGDRRRAVRVDQHRQDPRQEHLPQARRVLPPRRGRARPRAAAHLTYESATTSTTVMRASRTPPAVKIATSRKLSGAVASRSSARSSSRWRCAPISSSPIARPA